MSDAVRLAMVGCGGMARQHLRGYGMLYERGCRDFEVVAVCDPVVENAEGFADDIEGATGKRPRVYGDLAPMLADGDIDAADIVTPHCFHHSLGVACLEAGLHVMVEKPLGITVRASRLLIETAEKQGRILATAENIRRHLGARAAHWAVNEARLIGDPRMFSVQMMTSGEFNTDSPAMRWRAVKALTGGGMIMDSGAHFADMVLHLFGDVESVDCQMRTFDAPEVDAPVIGRAQLDVEDSWMALLHFESGLMGTWMWSRSAHGVQSQHGLYWGSEGALVSQGFLLHPFQNGAELKRSDGGVKSARELEIEYLLQLPPADRDRLFPCGLTDGVAIECWDFVDAIRSGRSPEVDGHAGLRAKALCEACYESAAGGAPVRVADVVSGKVRAYQEPIDDRWEL